MITDEALERLLAEAADLYAPPADGPEQIVAAAKPASVPKAARRRPPRRAVWLSAAAAALIGTAAVASALSGGGGGATKGALTQNLAPMHGSADLSIAGGAKTASRTSSLDARLSGTAPQ